VIKTISLDSGKFVNSPFLFREDAIAMQPLAFGCESMIQHFIESNQKREATNCFDLVIPFMVLTSLFQNVQHGHE
jgi:hypothetical protein